MHLLLIRSSPFDVFDISQAPDNISPINILYDASIRLYNMLPESHFGTHNLSISVSLLFEKYVKANGASSNSLCRIANSESFESIHRSNRISHIVNISQCHYHHFNSTPFEW